MRLHPPSRRVADFDRDAGRGELRDRLVGDRAHQDVDLDLVVAVDAQAPRPQRVAHRGRCLRAGTGDARLLQSAANRIGEYRGELRGGVRLQLRVWRGDEEKRQENKSGARRRPDVHHDHWTGKR